MTPERRHRLALWTLWLSLAGAVVTLPLWLLDVLTTRSLVGVTLVLSFITQGTTAWDVVSTTDVRVQQEDE